MYSWGDNMSNWHRPGAYRFDQAQAKARAAAARQSGGSRSYSDKQQPIVTLTDPRKTIGTRSRNPLVIATDVTGSMRRWPFEIFDRLPLLYQTLSQYRPDLEMAFMAVGDANVDRFPLQVTDFAKGYQLEKQLDAIYGEGGGSAADPSESYGLLAYSLLHHVEIPSDLEEKPFCIVFGDVSMQDPVPAQQLHTQLGAAVQADVPAVAAWQEVCRRWNVWFLSRPGRLPQAEVDQQWARAIGPQQHVHIKDEPRAVDYAMGLIARSWGHFDNFQQNLRARQDNEVVARVAADIKQLKG